MSANYLDQPASFVTDTRLQDLDDSTVFAAKNVLLDTFGAILAGSRLPESASFARLAGKMGGSGPATLLAHRGDARNPVSQGELLSKFVTLASDTLGEERTQEVIDTVYRLNGLGDVRELTRLLVGNQERKQSPGT